MPTKIDNRNDGKQRTLPLDLPASPSVWRPIHYLGSKLRLTDSIRDLLDELGPGPVCDLFAGSGTVSLALSHERDVVAADIQEYSRVLCTALLRPASLDNSDVTKFLTRVNKRQTRLEPCLAPILDFEQRAIQWSSAMPDMLCDLSEHGSLIAGQPNDKALATAMKETAKRIEQANAEAQLMATRYFGGSYFSFRQSLQIDSILGEIREARETYLAALLSTASQIVNSVGKQFAQPMRPRRKDGSIKTNLIQQMCRDRSQDAVSVFTDWLSKYRELENLRQHRIIRDDYRAVLANLCGVSVIYADPPYTRDHYSRFYHVLETLCLCDSPSVSTTALTGEGATSRGLYRTDRHQSPFCIKSQAPGAFTEMFAAAQGLPMLVSYSPFIKDGHPRMMTVDAVAAIAKRHYRRVDITSAGLTAHSKLNRTDLHLDASSEPEVFIVCR